VGGKWSPSDGVDLGLNYSYEKMFVCSAAGTGSGCTDDTSVPNQIAATVGNTAQHKVNLTALWRTRANIDLGLDLHFVSALSWTEGSFDITRPGGVLYTTYPLSAYTLVNGKVAYSWVKDKLETGVAFYNLLDDGHREHPFGNQLGRRILFTAAGSF
jgi:iron complex outermembrane receptor protein